MSDHRELIRPNMDYPDPVRLKEPTDTMILEYLEEKVRDVPGNIANSIDRHPTYVSDRIKQLEDYGLVEDTGHSVFKLTAKGDAFLSGEIDEDDLEPTTSD